MTTTLGIDVGTQSLKALLLGPSGETLATASAPLAVLPDLPAGHSEQHPADWLVALRACAAELRQQQPAAWRAVEALGVSGQQHGLVVLDERGEVVRPAKLWNDVSSAPQCDAIVKDLGGRDKLFAATGNWLPPGFTGGKLRWLRDHEPANFARVRAVLLPHDYVNYWLTGRRSMEHGDASGTGFFDVRRRCFAPQVCDAIAPGLRDWLPPLLEPGEPAGTLRPAAAKELGLREAIPVAPGGGDNMMAAIGSGAVRPGIAVLSLGTSGTVFACAPAPVCDPQGEIAAFCDSTGRWLPLGCTMNATVSSELTRTALGRSLLRMEQEATAVPAGADGLLCVPFFTGERSPDLPHGKGAFVGLTPRSFTPGHLQRAAIEGATFALARLLDRLEALGVPIGEVRLTGGGSQSELWRQIAAAVLGRRTRAGVSPDAAALGAAVQARWTLRRLRDARATIETCVDELRLDAALRDLPSDAAWQATYQQRRAVYDEVVTALAPVFERI
jgi:D-xylulose kinase